MTNDVLNPSVLQKKLKKHANGMQIHVLNCCPSTNTLAKELALSDPDLTALIVAHSQSDGRGRQGRSFLSPDGTGIYVSIAFPLTGTLSSALPLTCAASVAVMRAIRALTGLQTGIKWVNDLLLDGRKVCGILTEAVTVGSRTSLIVGIGINLRPMAFPKELEHIAGTLNQPTLPRADLISEIVMALIPYIQDPSDQSWLDDYRRYSCVLGKEILRIENGTSLPCTAQAIDERGRLLIRYPNGEEELLQSGEISIRFQ